MNRQRKNFVEIKKFRDVLYDVYFVENIGIIGEIIKGKNEEKEKRNEKVSEQILLLNRKKNENHSFLFVIK